MQAPDYAEPLEAWRVWKVVRREGRYLLGSVIQRTTWPAGEPLRADCLRPRRWTWLRRKQPHAAPEQACECGVYAAALERIGQYLAEAPCRSVSRVLGRVSLWGTVVECERGFRAASAYPARISVPADAGRPWGVDWEEVALGLWDYGVPVEPLSAYSRNAGDVLAELKAA